jgi:beta-1,4-mannosyl-glycoprotein beta-1,4-N-acetylglucosaminyltransferase
MIYDCFSYFNEKDLLTIRLNGLSDYVDKFVLVEATRTHTGLPKPLYYQDNKHLFSEFESKIIHVIVEDMPMSTHEIQDAISPQDRLWLAGGYQMGDNWVRERFQRNAIMRGLVDASDDDIIIISDADEIVRPSILKNIEQTIVDGSNAVKQDLRSYYLNIECTNMEWFGSKILRKKFIVSPSEARFHTPSSIGIVDGGWHCAWMGGAENIQLKLKSYAHSEFNTPDILNSDNINSRIGSMKDVLGRLYEYKVIPVNGDTMPKYVMDYLDKFDHMIYKASA